jgi:hypothetical protein
MVGAVGIEPTTFGLKGRCSTTELRPYMLLNILHGNNFADLGGIEVRGQIPSSSARRDRVGAETDARLSPKRELHAA